MHTYMPVSHKLTQSQMSGDWVKFRFQLKMSLSKCRSRCSQAPGITDPSLDANFSDLPIALAGNLDYSFPKRSYKPNVQRFLICSSNTVMLTYPFWSIQLSTLDRFYVRFHKWQRTSAVQIPRLIFAYHAPLKRYLPSFSLSSSQRTAVGNEQAPTSC